MDKSWEQLDKAHKLWKQPHAVAWAIVHDDTSEGLNVVYNVLCASREGAYKWAGRALGVPPYTTKQIRGMGYRAKRVRITLEE